MPYTAELAIMIKTISERIIRRRPVKAGKETQINILIEWRISEPSHFRLKHPLSTFDFGIESYTGNAVFLEAHRQNMVNFSEAGFSTGLLRLRRAEYGDDPPGHLTAHYLFYRVCCGSCGSGKWDTQGAIDARSIAGKKSCLGDPWDFSLLPFCLCCLSSSVLRFYWQ